QTADRKSACRWVSAANATRRPRDRAARSTARRSSDGSTASARPSPRSSRYALLPNPSSTTGISPSITSSTPWRSPLSYSYTIPRNFGGWPLGDRDRKTALFDQFARVGKALASGKRLELLDLLAQGERDVASLAAAADLGVTTASAHLQTLRQANLVTTRRDGTRILYRLAGPDVAQLYARLRDVAQSHLPDVEAARVAYLGADGGEPVTREQLQKLARRRLVTVLDV